MTQIETHHNKILSWGRLNSKCASQTSRTRGVELLYPMEIQSLSPSPPHPLIPTPTLCHASFLFLSPPPLFLPPLTEPWASSCWLNFLDDVRVHVHWPCRWCFWMNECPLPSPLLVLRDVYKSRSPGQPAEFHEIPRCESEKRDW